MRTRIKNEDNKKNKHVCKKMIETSSKTDDAKVKVAYDDI